MPLGLNKTIQEIQHRYTWKGITSDVESYIKRCKKCQQSNIIKQTHTEGTVIDPPQHMHEHIYADICGPFQNQDGTYKILMIIDGLSRYSWIFPLRENFDMRSILQDFFITYGSPVKFITDNDSIFKNKIIPTLLKQLNIKEIVISALHPQSNGLCERVIGTFKRLINKNQAKNLMEFRQITLNYNTSIHSVTQIKPFEAYFGRPCEKPVKEKYDHDKRTEEQRMLENLLYNCTNEGKQKNKSVQVKRRTGKLRSYEKGDLVRVKMNSGWSSPVVIRDINPSTHTVTICLNNGLTRRHFDEISPYYDPFDVSDAGNNNSDMSDASRSM